MSVNVVFSSIYKNLTRNNYLFENQNAHIGENLLLPAVELKKSFSNINVNLCTPDMVPIEDISLFVFSEMPDADDPYYKFATQHNIQMILIISELELIHPANASIIHHHRFRKIFTYQDRLIDNKKYFKLNYSFNFPQSINKSTDRKKLCTLISCNKTLNHPKELYSKRVEAIRWFERHHLEDFDLFGIGWEGPNYFHGSKYKRVINRSVFLRKLFSKPYSSYRGKVDSKIETLKNYKFCICYENAKDVPGWITEKIFDCFMAGCVPIYWGADNVTEHIPSSCFIDKRQFQTYDELYEYISTMPDSEYLGYLAAIEEYFKSEQAYEYTIDYYVKTLGGAIKEMLL